MNGEGQRRASWLSRGIVSGRARLAIGALSSLDWLGALAAPVITVTHREEPSPWPAAKPLLFGQLLTHPDAPSRGLS